MWAFGLETLSFPARDPFLAETCSQKIRRVATAGETFARCPSCMVKRSGAVHVVRVVKKHTDKQGHERDHRSAYLRRPFRQDEKVINETVANLSALPWHVIDSIEAGLKGERLVGAGTQATMARSLPHGHVAAVFPQARSLGLPEASGTAPRHGIMAQWVPRVGLYEGHACVRCSG